MLKKLIMTAVAMSMSAALFAEINFDNPGSNNLKEQISGIEISQPAPAVAEMDKKASKEKEWTVMVYINGKNNLEEFALKDMNEMEMIGSNDQVNIVTEVGRMDGYDTSDGDWKTTRRFLVKKDSNTNKISSPVLKDLGDVDMGDYNSVIDFGNWAKKTYPAKKYMLIIWNHGSGWEKSAAVTKGISYDEVSGNHITTPQLGLALKGIGGVDVYGSDACLMQMPEVDYEIKDYVQYIVGSEETEPGDGYTYNDFLGPVAKNPTMTPEELGKQATNAYINHYQQQGEAATQSLVKTAALSGYVAAVNDFVAAAMATKEQSLVKTAVSNAQSFAVAENKDACDFLSLYAASSKNSAVKAKAKALQDYITGTLVVLGTNSNMPKAKGLSVYMPSYGYNTDYNELAWAKATQWDEFIKWYTK